MILNAMLIGHEDWVCGVSWQPRQLKDGKWHQPKCLISASMDKSMMVWKPEKETGIWLNEMRVGDIGGQNYLGFFDAVFSADGRSILGHGFNGSFRLWQKAVDESGSNVLLTFFVFFFL